ncbi:MAG: DUF2461 domain-containing protein [Blastocatellia bacterium]|nr:DUF2461 domain-containing protein [Blastocatellia bacterium]
MMAMDIRFTPQLFAFFRELKANNNREWFELNKPRYLEDVRDPLLAFIAAIGPHLRDISPLLVADPKRSMFRIYRDVRFSKNKAPYKTHASAYFFHQTVGKDGPGMYLHLDPEGCFMGVGFWQPDPATRTKITNAIAAKPDEWGAIVREKEFRKLWKMEGESMAKLPRQYDPAHPFADDLTRKDFIIVARFTEKQAGAKDFLDRIDRLAHSSGPYLGFVCRAIGLKW